MDLVLFIVSLLLIMSLVYIFSKNNTHEREIDKYKESIYYNEVRCNDKYYPLVQENKKLKAELETLKNKQNGK